MKTARSCFTLFAACALCFSLNAGEPPAKQALDSKAAFEKLKTLTGDWQGSIDQKSGGPPISVSYKTTSGGNTVTETLFVGTPHEMVTVYYLDAGQLVLIHYCSAGNQPRMALAKNSASDLLVFEFAGGTNLNPEKDMHMHSARLRFEEDGYLVGEWDSFRDGKKAGTHKFFLTRKPQT